MFQVYELWQWQKGKRYSYHSCGGLVALKNGRYGLYYKYYACSASRSA